MIHLNITLIGYSYGGGFALLGSLSDHSVKKVVSIAGGDLNIIAKELEQNDVFRKQHQTFLDKFMLDKNVTRGLGGKASHDWLFKHKGEYDLLKYSSKLTQKSILFISGWQDQAILLEDHILPLYRLFQNLKAKNLSIHVFDSDHSFSNVHDKIS